jgi:hypothetical protein
MMGLSMWGAQDSHYDNKQKNGRIGITPLLGMSIALATLSGCAAVTGFKDHWNYSSSWNEMMVGYRNKAWSSKAWHCRKNSFCREKHLHEFHRGFLAGYQAVADGSDGCTPAFAPREYWSWKYQTSEGQNKVAAWFAGYPHGARAAEEDGVGNWTQMQSSYGIQQEYAQFGMNGGQNAGLYPMPESPQVPTGSTPSTPNSSTPTTLLMNQSTIVR